MAHLKAYTTMGARPRKRGVVAMGQMIFFTYGIDLANIMHRSLYYTCVFYSRVIVTFIRTVTF